jgi:hypothetical protein
MGIQVRAGPDDQFCLCGLPMAVLLGAMLVSGTGLEGNPAAIL